MKYRERLSGIKSFIAHFVLLVFSFLSLYGQKVSTSVNIVDELKTYSLSNDKISVSVTVDSGKLVSDEVKGQPDWLKQYGTSPMVFTTDADFAAEIMWTEWQAPKFVNNAENPVTLTKDDFIFDTSYTNDLVSGAKDLNLRFKGSNQNLVLTMTYRLEPGAFYLHRMIAFSDTGNPEHFLQKIFPHAGFIMGKPTVVKEGGFGQPIALQYGNAGVFFGYEYPAADNILQTDSKGTKISCGAEIGERIGKTGISSEWVVEGISPNSFLKLWFMNYVDAIRVAPLKPYTLYNSWYDLRSPEYPRVPEGNVMNEKNIFRIIDLIDKNMIEKHHIQLDAFVLDDGWDVYKSDWVLRQHEFPNGLKSISDELKKTNTSLGLWFGPIGGYSFRKQRVGWMKEHGYEVVGDEMCVGGEKYGALLKKRVADFTEKEGVSYFKWDGIQFSCNEPDHGHPVGIYSRRAVMNNLLGMVDTVRSKNPNMFLNITSGTWLSPWWVKYANQIWMQGEDYGYADVPSVSPRDAAITYRDLSLYDDFKTNNFWFPIQSLMTHGIIKGNLEKLGGNEEPLDKFTNEALLYFARGVSMWELYISPDILTEGEWNAMSDAMIWAKDRFPILSTTEMIGGDPKKRETYGYAHYKGKRGIIAARNPWIVDGSLKVNIAPEQGIDPDATDLVLEKVYPDRWISPVLYKTGSSFDIPLEGYETAVYELYPLSDASMPLVAGVPFEVTTVSGKSYEYALYGKAKDMRILNDEDIVHASSPSTGNEKDQDGLFTGTSTANLADKGHGALNFDLPLSSSITKATLAILLTPGKESEKLKLPKMTVTIDGKQDTAAFEKGEGNSTWYTVDLGAGNHTVRTELIPRDPLKPWSYQAAAWMIGEQKQSGEIITVEASKEFTAKPMPPRPFPTGVRVVKSKLGEFTLGTVK